MTSALNIFDVLFLKRLGLYLRLLLILNLINISYFIIYPQNPASWANQDNCNEWQQFFLHNV